MIRLFIVLVLCGLSSWEYGRLQYAKGYFSGAQAIDSKYGNQILSIQDKYKQAADSYESSFNRCEVGWKKSTEELNKASDIIDRLVVRVKQDSARERSLKEEEEMKP